MLGAPGPLTTLCPRPPPPRHPSCRCPVTPSTPGQPRPASSTSLDAKPPVRPSWWSREPSNALSQGPTLGSPCCSPSAPAARLPAPAHPEPRPSWTLPLPWAPAPARPSATPVPRGVLGPPPTGASPCGPTPLPLAPIQTPPTSQMPFPPPSPGGLLRPHSLGPPVFPSRPHIPVLAARGPPPQPDCGHGLSCQAQPHRVTGEQVPTR